MQHVAYTNYISIMFIDPLYMFILARQLSVSSNANQYWYYKSFALERSQTDDQNCQILGSEWFCLRKRSAHPTK